jgi:hypothetical protein
MNLKQEIRQTIINNRIIAKKIYRMHQEGKTVNQIYKALFEFDFVTELFKKLKNDSINLFRHFYLLNLYGGNS